MENDWNTQDSPARCGACDRDLFLGADALVVTEGVVGHRGLVPLEAALWFCSVNCLAVHFGDEHRERDAAQKGDTAESQFDFFGADGRSDVGSDEFDYSGERR